MAIMDTHAHRQAIKESGYADVFYVSDRYPRTEKKIIFTEGSLNYLKKIKGNGAINIQRVIQSAKYQEIDEESLIGLEEKILYPQTSYLHEPPPPAHIEEIILFLLQHPQLSLEYMGRTSIAETEKNVQDVFVPGKLFSLDVCGGSRHYVWRTHGTGAQEHILQFQPSLENLRQWFLDPDARVVLSVGSGGLRMFGVTTFFKILDMMGVRRSISEIWGCSGGSIAGYLYSIGVPPHAIEQAGYDLYNERTKEVPLFRSTWRTALNLVKHNLLRVPDPTDGLMGMKQGFYQLLERFHGVRNQLLPTIPFFCVSTSIEQGIGFALTTPQWVHENCHDFLIGCDLVKAVLMSSAVPFLMPTETLKLGTGQNLTWADGAFCEDVPLYFPYTKWFRECQLPQSQTPKKLKIFYVDLGTRMVRKDSRGVREHSSFLRRHLGRVGQLLDVLVDTRILHLQSVLNTIPGVEVLGLRLELGQSAVFDIKHIPYIMQTSRRSFLSQLSQLNDTLAHGRWTAEHSADAPSQTPIPSSPG